MGSHANTTDFVCFKANGSLDSSFGSNGYFSTATVNISLDRSDYPSPVLAIQPDNKIVFIGGFYQTTDQEIIGRLNSNGSFDNTFGNKGLYTPQFPDIDLPFGALTLDIQPDGKILLPFGTNQFLFVARYLNDLTLGIINFSSPNNSALIYPNPIHQTATLKYTLNETENITISLFDVSGRVVKTFVASQNQATGNYSEQLSFDSNIPAGNYFLVISNGKQKETVKIIKQ